MGFLSFLFGSKKNNEPQKSSNLQVKFSSYTTRKTRLTTMSKAYEGVIDC